MLSNPNPESEFHILLEYFNSGSVKQVLDILIMLEQIISSGKKIKVCWFYNEDDDLMEMKGEEFKSMVKVPFELKVY